MKLSLFSAYAISTIVVLVLHYVIPYTILRGGLGLCLYWFWALLSLAWIVITIAFVEKAWRV